MRIFIVSDDLNRTMKFLNAILTARNELYERLVDERSKKLDVKVFAPKGKFYNLWGVENNKIRLGITSTVKEDCTGFEAYEVDYEDVELTHPTGIVREIIEEMVKSVEKGEGKSFILLLTFYEHVEQLETFISRFLKMYLSLNENLRREIGKRLTIFLNRPSKALNLDLTEMERLLNAKVYDVYEVLPHSVSKFLNYFPFECEPRRRDRKNKEGRKRPKINLFACIPNDLCSLLDFLVKASESLKEAIKSEDVHKINMIIVIYDLLNHLKRRIEKDGLEICGLKVKEFSASICERVQPCKVLRSLFSFKVEENEVVEGNELVMVNAEGVFYSRGFEERTVVVNELTVRESSPPSAVCAPLSYNVLVETTLKPKERRPKATWSLACLEHSNVHAFLNALKIYFPWIEAVEVNARINDLDVYLCNLPHCLREARCGKPFPKGERLFISITFELLRTKNIGRLRAAISKGYLGEIEHGGFRYYFSVPFFCDVPPCPLWSLTVKPKGFKHLYTELRIVELRDIKPFESKGDPNTERVIDIFDEIIRKFEECYFYGKLDDEERFIAYAKLLKDVNLAPLRNKALRCFESAFYELRNAMKFVFGLRRVIPIPHTLISDERNVEGIINLIEEKMGMEREQAKQLVYFMLFEYFLRTVRDELKRNGRKGKMVSEELAGAFAENVVKYFLKDLHPLL